MLYYICTATVLSYLASMFPCNMHMHVAVRGIVEVRALIFFGGTVGVCVARCNPVCQAVC